MSCLFSNCKLKNEERFLTCWICDGLAHYQCAGFNGRDFDKINDSSRGLRWSCTSCRSLDINFYRLFKEAKVGFSAMSSELLNLTVKFRKFEELFNDFDLGDSPRRKKSLGRLGVDAGHAGNSSALDAGHAANSPALRDVSLLFSSPAPAAVVSAPSVVDPPAVVVTAAGEGVGLGGPGGLGGSAAAGGHTRGSDGSAASVCVDQVVVGSTNPVDTIRVDGGVTPSQLASALPVGPGGGSSGFSERCILDIVPPRRTVFVSRFTPVTSVDDIKRFIKENIRLQVNESDFRVFKFNFSQPRDISSFRIIAPSNLFDVLVDRSFWPPGVIVREFVHRDRPGFAGAVSIPKN